MALMNNGSERHDYTDSEIEALAAILQREAPDTMIDNRALRDRLMDLLIAVGLAYEDEFGAAFNALLKKERASSTASHAELARHYRAIGEADDPFRKGLITRSIVCTELNALARARRPRRQRTQHRYRVAPQSSGEKPFLEEVEENLAMLRELARTLADYHQSFVHRGAPQKSVQDTLLIELSNIYLEFTGLPIDRFELPHSRLSRFIKFAYAALRPFLSPIELSETALYHRWKRLKDANNEAKA